MHWRFDLFLKREENNPGGRAMTRFISNMVIHLSEAYSTVSVNNDPWLVLTQTEMPGNLLMGRNWAFQYRVKSKWMESKEASG